jgi:tRNA(Ile)-lysidine synthase
VKRRGRSGRDAAPRPDGDFSSPWLALRLRELIGPLRGRRLCLAYSGGLDSSALLHALARLRRTERFALRALHVNHALQPEAGRWAEAAQRQARRWRVACVGIELKLDPAPGESLEALARAARYAALARHLQRGELLLTAHHQEDQLETVLLALLRGSGVRGLAAMSALTPWCGTLLLRPLLSVARTALERYCHAEAIEWSEDPSNADARFDRNYLRLQVLPLLRARWPAVAATASRSAAHLLETRSLLDLRACEALAEAHDGAALRVSVVRRLAEPERRNALRYWIGAQGLPPPDHRRLAELAGALLCSRADALPSVRWRGGIVRRHGDRLIAAPESAEPQAGTSPESPEPWDWRAQPWVALADGGALGLTPERHGDVRLAALPQRLYVRFRRGGERLHSAHGRVALKDLLQSEGVAPWRRARVPLVMHQDRIIAVADLWLDHAYRAHEPGGVASERGRFRWHPADGALKRKDCI